MIRAPLLSRSLGLTDYHSIMQTFRAARVLFPLLVLKYTKYIQSLIVLTTKGNIEQYMFWTHCFVPVIHDPSQGMWHTQLLERHLRQCSCTLKPTRAFFFSWCTASSLQTPNEASLSWVMPTLPTWCIGQIRGESRCCAGCHGRICSLCDCGRSDAAFRWLEGKRSSGCRQDSLSP